MEPYPRTWAEIDLGALKHNLSVVREIVGSDTVVALVCKADAYGHGLIPTGRYAVRNGANWLAVATVQEGVALREAGVEVGIMVMSPILAVEIDQAVFYRLDVFVESMEMGERFSAAALSLRGQARLHLKVDTGLHRFGVAPGLAVGLAVQLRSLEGVNLVGIGQHFVDSAFDAEKTERQRVVFRELLVEFDRRGVAFEYVHEDNSAGTVTGDGFGGTNMVRVGLFAYGYDPAGLTGGRLRPVMSWKARVTSVREVSAGETVSYSSTYRLDQDSKLATLGVGYGDGYDRSLSSKGFVFLRGVACPVVGLVCMDQMVVDVTDLPEVEIGDVAELVGPDCSATELSRLAGTNTHEILCRVMSRVSRRYLYP